MKEGTVHPTKAELRDYMSNLKGDSGHRKEIAQHLENCDFCAEFCRDLRSLTEPIEPVGLSQIGVELQELHLRAHKAALRSSTIDLVSLKNSASNPSTFHMAADGVSGSEHSIRNIATLCSETPEVVLRVMRDDIRRIDYIHVAAEDRTLSSHVMVRLPDLGREFITDADGIATIDLEDLDSLENMKWQLSAPDAVFDLKLLELDTAHLEYSKELILETERNDRIEIRFEGRTTEKRLLLQVVALEGKSVSGPVQVTIVQGDLSLKQSTESHRSVEFLLHDLKTPILIRLYR